MSNNEIEVSICIVAYNQEKYIAQCLESVINQKTDFRFEIIIGEDCSTDKTKAIIESYIDRYPGLITAKFHESNIGASKNVFSTYNLAKGRYIAHLDGDDYFLPNKLQVQKDFMDNNPTVTLSFHRSKVIFPNNNITYDNYDINTNPTFYSKHELILFGAIGGNSSKMFIAKNHQLFMKIYNQISFPVLDYLYNSIIVDDGDVGYVPSEPLCVYRRGIGISATNPKLNSYHYKSYDFIADHFNGVYNDHLGTRALLGFLADLKNKRDYKLSLKYARKYTTLKSIALLKKYSPIFKTLNWPKQ